ncbi:aminotransferase class V-fold PLP-dependent enzyme [Elizabethkingia argentiflava]|uniref:cysteine desulfurase n=1 Tax=Elizabethkingia argenteiflava TaxID=2681556 RepID=A0A845PW12_9FLAO|nr:cysteine desulfurase family protein [Elizabethkingia argenteiflava]NAW51056.1 aminotransferase class V-fold PLP-dependent enzyme [Elizabethkingia argenteiflava]
MNRVYLDNAATTPLREEVIAAMVEVMKVHYGNPSSTYSIGQEAKAIIEENRRKVAQYLQVSPAEIIFTSCGTEANNMIIKSCVNNLGIERIITSPLEHKCVAETSFEMKHTRGVELVYLKPNQKGDLDLNQLESLLQNSKKKTLVTLMHANNEIANLLDIEKVATLCKQYQALYHSDTVQTVGHLPLDFSRIKLDFASCSAHKFHGPKGAGFAFVRKFSGIKGLIVGGAQERGLRAGTENVSGIVGLGKALELAVEHMQENTHYMEDIKAYAVEQLSQKLPGVIFNGRSAERGNSLYTLLSVLLPFKNPLIGFQLDMRGIAVSQGSACSSGAAKPSMVMLSILTDDQLENTTPLRLSFSHMTTKQDIDRLVETLLEIKEMDIEKMNV